MGSCVGEGTAAVLNEPVARRGVCLCKCWHTSEIALPYYYAGGSCRTVSVDGRHRQQTLCTPHSEDLQVSSPSLLALVKVFCCFFMEAFDLFCAQKRAPLEGVCCLPKRRFVPYSMNKTAGDLGRIHSTNERVLAEDFTRAICTYTRMIELLSSR